jgi:hypothetical protein
MSSHPTSVANDAATTTRHEITVTAIADKIGRNDLTADDQAEVDFWTAALEEHSNRAMLNISRQALAKLLGIIGKLRTEQREPVSQEAPGLPPGESPQRDAICDALTEALLYVGSLAHGAGERETINLRSELEIRGLARLLTARDGHHVNWIDANTRKLWERIGTALASRSAFSGIPRTENEESARLRFGVREIGTAPRRRDKWATRAREYFDERNRPAVSWDGMPSVQDQKRRRDRIAELLEALSSSGSPASPLSEKDVALVNELRYSAARAKVNVVLEVSEAAALCDLFARLSASAPSPEDAQAEICSAPHPTSPRRSCTLARGHDGVHESPDHCATHVWEGRDPGGEA